MIGTQQDFSMLSDQQLKQAMMFAQRSNNTPEFLGLMAEAKKRQSMRQEAQGAQAGQQATQSPTTAADQVMSGIANLASGDQEYAGGGIVAFADGDLVRDSAGNELLSDEELRKRIEERATAQRGQQVSPLEAMRRMRDMFRTSIGLAPAGSPEAAPTAPSTAPPAPRDTTPSVSVPGGVAAARAADNAIDAARSAPAPKAPSPGITALAAAQKAKTAETSTPAAPAYVEPPILTAAQQKAADEALAKGDNDKVDAIFAKATERDAKRRAELDAETTGKKGWLGAEMSPETRKMLRDAGIAMLTSKNPNALGGIGEGLSAASKGYEEGKQKRQERLDLSDAAEEKRQLSIMAAKQGNTALANKYSSQENDLREKAAGRALERDKMSATERHQKVLEDLQRQQLGVSRVAALRETDADKYIRNAMKENPKLSYTQAYEQFASGKRPLTQAAALASYAELQKQGKLPEGVTDFPSYYRMLTGAGGGGALSNMPSLSAIQAELARRQGQ